MALSKKAFLNKSQKILQSLLDTEFKKVKKTVYLTWLPRTAGSFWKKVFKSPQIEALWFSPIKIIQEFPQISESKERVSLLKKLKSVEIIIFNSYAQHLLKYSDEEIKELLRHELLHIEMQTGHDDHHFISAAMEREIYVHARDIFAHVDQVDLNQVLHYLDER